ncbi:polysaccharide pyruvyl transferase family protein [Tamlana sp. 62-3]|uniref:Polysaccharide pyruvyl transferase family protein n=1 Tax=Neotamlana sargassicola TaxID=2883125 RepID=A0A9X1L3Q3_9FLAO|nr:polysaccharide pyruvyl transferase family protein [Tamlana sargassicola]MCB4807305.1 polysaccharide pyruvyl transferase family protein [Tamlana sargassicola]
MTIQIDGVNTQNKGAELMLVAVLEELETRFPNSTVFINPDSNLNFKLLPKYKLNIKYRPGLKLGNLVNKVFGKLKIKQPFGFFNQNYAVGGVDMILDASGFKYSDQWNRSMAWLNSKKEYYQNARNKGTKIYFLTQAFGPFKTEEGIASVKMLSTYCDLIFAREVQSYQYLQEANVDVNKTKVSCDFTFKVKGIVPNNFKHLKNHIVIIPNKKMITHGGDNSGNYLNLLKNIINYFLSKGERIFLLNHEGEGDLEICKLINSELRTNLEIVSGLPAKEIKGLIGNSKLTVSSRFHGVASALSQGVPCLSTSWNHKYEMLFKIYGQENCIINSDAQVQDNLLKVEKVYNNYTEISKALKIKKVELLKEIDQMWNAIFNNYKLH